MVNHFIRYQTKPNATVQAPVQPGVFTHDCSVLLTVPPPYIHERRPRGKKEREGLLQGHSFKILFSDYYLTQQHFKSDYCTVYHIPLYFLTIGWILHVIQYIYTRYEILLCSSQYIRYICIYTHLICTYT